MKPRHADVANFDPVSLKMGLSLEIDKNIDMDAPNFIVNEDPQPDLRDQEFDSAFAQKSS